MKPTRSKLFLLAGLVLLGPGAHAQMQHRDASRECTLPDVASAWARPHATMPTRLDTIGADRAGDVGQPYRGALAPCSGTHCKPGQFFGLFPVRVLMPGRYRVAVDVPVWIDVVTSSGLAEGLVCEHTGCEPIRKIMQFELKAGIQWVSLAGARPGEVGFLVLPVRD